MKFGSSTRMFRTSLSPQKLPTYCIALIRKTNLADLGRCGREMLREVPNEGPLQTEINASILGLVGAHHKRVKWRAPAHHRHRSRLMAGAHHPLYSSLIAAA